MSIKAVIDVGTNSIKLLVMESGPSGGAVRLDESRVVRLGEGVEESGVLESDAMERACSAIEDMAGRARSAGADGIAAVGTQAMRRARNSDDFIRMSEARCGVRIRVISGDEEAGLSFRAVAAALAPGDAAQICLFDVGGGSSEVALGFRSSVSFRKSLPIGALSLRDKFFVGFAEFADEGSSQSEDGGVPASVLASASDYVRSLLESELGGLFDGAPGGARLYVGVGGTITTLAAVKLGLETGIRGGLSGTALDMPEMNRQIALYSSMSTERRALIRGLPADRAGIILPGALITRELMMFFGVCGADRLTVSDRGLRYGVMDAVFGIS